MYEPESDAARWGFNFLDVDNLFSSNYYGDNAQHNMKICHENYVEDNNHYDSGYNNTENDVYIAHALQEELMQLSIAEASSQGYLQTSTEPQNWHSPVRNYYTGEEPNYEDVEVSSTYSSPGDRSYEGEDYFHTLEIADEFELDGEVGKRLNQMVPIPHIPRINGDIPSIDEATSDHQRLIDRLQLYDLIEHKVAGDGNCQFRALSDQIYRTPEHHKIVRKQVVNQLKAHPDIYEGYVPMAYADYLKRIPKSGEWGDHVTLQAAADSYGVKILVLTSFKDTCYIEILPKIQKSERVVYLSFWAEVHYNSIYPQGDLLPSDFKLKKKWWKFRN